MTGEALRLDKLLWFIRLAKTRALAQERIAAGHMRLNGRRIERIAQPVRAGDVLTLAVAGTVLTIEIVVLPARRGPASEAQACYRTLDACRAIAIAAGETAQPPGEPPP
jgi:ribosomal 50S subunit-recycling heat shock protein